MSAPLWALFLANVICAGVIGWCLCERLWYRRVERLLKARLRRDDEVKASGFDNRFLAGYFSCSLDECDIRDRELLKLSDERGPYA